MRRTANRAGEMKLGAGLLGQKLRGVQYPVGRAYIHDTLLTSNLRELDGKTECAAAPS